MGDVLKGDERGPKPEKSLHLILQGLEKNLPGITRIIGSQIAPYEKAQFQAEKRFAPQRAKLENFLYNQYAPQYAQTQNQLADIQAQGDLNRLQGAGGQGFRAAAGLAREQDPEYYAARMAASGRLQDMLNNPMTGQEMEAITRGIQRSNVNRGTMDIAGNANTAAAGMLYGQGARNRQVQNLQLASSLMPQFQTTDINSIYGMGTGKQPNQNLFAKDINMNNGGADLGNSVLSGSMGLQNNAMNINANRRSVMDYVGQAWQQSGLGQATGAMKFGA